MVYDVQKETESILVELRRSSKKPKCSSKTSLIKILAPNFDGFRDAENQWRSQRRAESAEGQDLTQSQIFLSCGKI